MRYRIHCSSRQDPYVGSSLSDKFGKQPFEPFSVSCSREHNAGTKCFETIDINIAYQYLELWDLNANHMMPALKVVEGEW